MTFMRAASSVFTRTCTVASAGTSKPLPANLTSNNKKNRFYKKSAVQICRSLLNRQSVPKVHPLSSYQCENKLHPSLSDCVNTSLLRDRFIPQKIFSNRSDHIQVHIIKPVDFNFRSVILPKWIRLSRCLHHQLKLMWEKFNSKVLFCFALLVSL